MRQIIPYKKDIVFKTNIACISSISLEHEELISDGEINGDFIVSGDYKIHNDTTEKEMFKYRLPFTTILNNDIKEETVVIDISDFNYEIIDDDVLRINIDYLIEADEIEDRIDVFEPKVIEDEIDEDMDKQIDSFINNREVVEEVTTNEKIINEIDEEYIMYHIHILDENESLEDIIKLYDTNVEYLSLYNDLSNLKKGDKIVIPEYNE